MKKISFEIAKKMGKTPAGVPGLVLSSIRWDGAEAVMLLKDGGLDAVKQQLDALKGRGSLLRYRARGKSLEVRAEYSPSELPEDSVRALLDFACSLEFASDDVTDILRFYSDVREEKTPSLLMEAFLADKGSLSLKASAFIDDEADPQDYFMKLMESLNRYGMGVIKN